MAAPAGVDVSDIGGISVYHNYEHHLQSVPAASHPEPFLLRRWLSEHAGGREQRSFVYQRGCQFHLQVRTGPQPFSPALHVQSGEEWLYIVDGSARVRLVEGREVRELALPNGSCYLIPAGTPKSLQLDDGCTALVMTRARKTGDGEGDAYPHWNKTHTVPHLTHLNGNAAEPLDEPDQLLWLCGKCGDVAHSQQFICAEYYEQTSSLVSEFDRQVAAGTVTCAACSSVYAAPAADAAALPLPASARAFPSIDPTTHMPPYHLWSWIDTHRHLLAPPVGNKMIHGRGAQWKVMIVGGPNERTDYHIDDGEEWFLMLKGDMVLKVVDDCGTRFRDIAIKEGESFLLPANVPHSPQRAADTIGLVIERERFTYELDGLRWYCANSECRTVLHTFSFRCGDLGTQLKTLITHWYDESPEAVHRRTCPKCGRVETKPDALAKIKQFSH